MLVTTFGFTLIQNLHIAAKIMSDKKDAKSLHGQICIGMLTVQEIHAKIDQKDIPFEIKKPT